MSVDRTTNLTLLWMQAQPTVEAYLNSLIRNRATAEDVLQQVALTATEKFEQFDHERSFTGWAMGIARNKALQHYSRAGTDRHLFSSELLMQLSETHERLSEQANDQRDALAVCLENLPPKTKALLERRYVQDLKPGKIADTLGLSANAVRLSLHRIRKTLRDCIEQRLRQQDAR